MVRVEEPDVFVGGGPDDAGATGVVVHLTEDEVDDVLESRVAAHDRHSQRHDALAERGLAIGDGGVEIGVGGVELGEHDGEWRAHLLALVPQGTRGCIDAVGCGDDEHRRIGGAQTGSQVTDEVCVSGGGDEVDHQIATGHRGDVQSRGPATVAIRRAIPGSGRRDEVVEQSGLARSAGADQHDVAQGPRGGDGGGTGGGVLSAHSSLCPRRVDPDRDFGPVLAAPRPGEGAQPRALG